MVKLLDGIQIIEVAPENIKECGLYCIKDKRSPGYRSKVEWAKAKANSSLRIKIATDTRGKQLGFIEYTRSETAWRPVKAKNYFFIHCIAVFGKAARHKQIASTLLTMCVEDAFASELSGVCTMTSDGAWMAEKDLFEKNGFVLADKRGRFELMVKQLNDEYPLPSLIDWTKQQAKYTGWNLVYADQCPWHDKSVADIRQSAKEHGIELNVIKLTTPKQAQKAPSGFGTFSLIKDGILLGDHYLSRTRFDNILRQEMK